MSLSVDGVGAVLLLLFALLHYLKILPSTRAVFAFLGIVIVGTVGFIGRLFADVGTWAQHIFGSVLNWAIGVPFTAGLFIIIVVLVIYALHPKNTAGRHTGWLALAAGILVVGGVQGIPALAGLHDAIISGVTNAMHAFSLATGR